MIINIFNNNIKKIYIKFNIIFLILLLNMKKSSNKKIKPRNSISKHFIKLKFPDIKVSQCYYKEGPIGLTLIEATNNNNFKVWQEVRGGNAGYVNTLSTAYKQNLYGICVVGGSLPALSAITGLTTESLKDSNYENFKSYNGACIYAQSFKKNKKVYADKRLAKFAYHQNDKLLYNGQAGAGSSASHGQGWGFKEIDEIKILVLCVNNAVGRVYKNNEIINHPIWDIEKKGIENLYKTEKKLGENTTIIVIITNLLLDNDDLKQMNQQVNVSIGKSIRPFNTLDDGDILYTCSTCKLKKELSFYEKISFFAKCSDVLEEAILNSILK